MSFVSGRMRLLAGTAALVAFNTYAGFVHPLLQSSIDGKYNAYGTEFSTALRQVSGDILAGGAARAFVVNLEDKLKMGPLSRPQMVWSDKEASPNLMVVGGVVPPASAFQTASIPFCAGNAARIVYKGYITTKGEIKADTTPFVMPVSAAPGRAPCQEWLLLEGKKFITPQ